ncbi:glycoside hydrolase family 2 protein [Granulicella sp. S190]|uniref:glycoside hydrolase family 2 protein n=1 Tax=Granulicella sp. S190 TaxID=1747226 RepID=UPI00131A7FB1|nr:glycoside hydrolase family 2 TIM barrel-domain containing protein [Granulicella sp. S190]
MNRRNFLTSTGAVLAAGTIAPVATSQAIAPVTTPGSRTILPINRGWRYSPKTSSEGHSPSFDDSSFTHVVVPHTNVRLPWHSFDEKTYEFISLYRRPLDIPASARGRRVFVDFEGVMTASTVYLNGTKLGEYRGGYTPFSFELTQHLDPSGKNLLSLDVDSTERADIPPFGNEVDYLTFGGIYREVALRIVPQTFVENIYARPKNVLSASPTVEVECFLDRAPNSRLGALSIRTELRREHDGNVLSSATHKISEPSPIEHHEADADQALGALPPSSPVPGSYTLTLDKMGKLDLWDLETPHLYTVHVQLVENGKVIDEDVRRIGFREATFTPQGFSLNGKIIKLHGLDRHQTFPFVGQAMPARVQRQDAKILRHDLRCNLVRTSHYPQSRHFLDACDEIGLLVLEEIPGWQHIGDKPWQDIAVDNVRRMIRRDWNHPSIILWGVRINESRDNHDFYTRTNALAHALDEQRQTGGIRYFQESEFLEDVFTMNDFGWPLKAPNHPLYLNTEFVGHTFPTKTIDSKERLQEFVVRHARVHDTLASNPQYAGGIGWCAFDYNTHDNFGSGDRICYHGVMDIFRTPKSAAGFYKSMCEPSEEIVLEPAFHWARNDESTGFTTAMISSNCDHLKLFVQSAKGDRLVGEGDPDRKQFPSLKHPPFSIPLGEGLRDWGDLRIEGYIAGKQVISKRYSGKGVDQQFVILPDDRELIADGADATRVVLRVNDEFGQVRPFANDAIRLELDGPGEIIGDNPFALIGGTGAIWIRTKEQPGNLRLHAIHPVLGTQTIDIQCSASSPEQA